jgi:hypothetical protein
MLVGTRPAHEACAPSPLFTPTLTLPRRGGGRVEPSRHNVCRTALGEDIDGGAAPGFPRVEGDGIQPACMAFIAGATSDPRLEGTAQPSGRGREP